MSGTIERIDSTDPMLREINRGLMVQWINADLLNRAGADVRTAVVLYDEGRAFMTALPARVTDAMIERVARVLHDGGVRFWSRGIV